MFRESFHQSVGNPVQRDQLPDTLPDTEFAVPDPPPGRVKAIVSFTTVILLLVWSLGRLANWPLTPE